MHGKGIFVVCVVFRFRLVEMNRSYGAFTLAKPRPKQIKKMGCIALCGVFHTAQRQATIQITIGFCVLVLGLSPSRSRSQSRQCKRTIVNNQSFSMFSVCGGSLTTPHGTFTSPLYPEQYTHRRQCTWDIEVEEGRSVTLTFGDFDLEHSEHCVFDGVKVRAICWVTFLKSKANLDFRWSPSCFCHTCELRYVILLERRKYC